MHVAPSIIVALLVIYSSKSQVASVKYRKHYKV